MLFLLMSTRTNRRVNAANAAANAQVEVGQVANPMENIENQINDSTDDFSWDSVMKSVQSEQTQDDIIRACLADARHFMRKNNLTIKNVKAYARKSTKTGRTNTRLTFVIKERIPGMVIDEEHTDAFGEPTKRLGPSNNIFTSAYAVSGCMKETAKGAIFADSVAGMTAVLAGQQEVEITGNANIANTLYAGGKCDVLCQFVPAGTPYRNPFSSSDEDGDVFDEDRIFHHVIRLEFGEVGQDTYKVRIMG